MPNAKILAGFFTQVHPSPSLVYGLAAGALLASFTERLGHTVHRQFHFGMASECTFAPKSSDPLWFVQRRQIQPRPLDLIVEWASCYASGFAASHAGPAMRAKLLLEERFSETLSSDSVAAAVASSPARLRREFSALTNATLVDYRTRVRLWHAVLAIAEGEKIEVAAWEVGWRSKKDLYRSCADILGVTPHEAGRWPVSQLSGHLFGRTNATTMPGPRGLH